MLLHSKYTSGQQARAEVLSVDGHRSRGDNAVHTLWGRGADARSTWDLPAGGDETAPALRGSSGRTTVGRRLTPRCHTP